MQIEMYKILSNLLHVSKLFGQIRFDENCLILGLGKNCTHPTTKRNINLATEIKLVGGGGGISCENQSIFRKCERHSDHMKQVGCGCGCGCRITGITGRLVSDDVLYFNNVPTISELSVGHVWILIVAQTDRI